MAESFESRALTGPLHRLSDSAWVRVCALLGMVSVQGAWQDAWHGSVPFRAFEAMRLAITRGLAPYVGTSIAARFAPFLSLGTAGLVLLASPYLGTGMNAALVLLAFGAMIFQLLVDPPFERMADGLDLPFMAFLAVSVLAVAFSPYPLLSAKGLAKLLVFWMSYFAFRSALKRGDGAWRWLFSALFVAALCQSLYGIYQWKIHVAPLALWDDAEAEVKLTRVYGTLRNPNLLSGYLLPVIPFAVAAAATWRGWILRALALATAVSAPICLYFTYSRGAYLGLAGEVIVLGLLGLVAAGPWLRKRVWARMAIALGFVALLAGGWWLLLHSPGMQERLASITATRTHSSNSFRLNVWDASWRMFRDSWWAGIGVGNDAFRRCYALYMISGFEALGAYNIFLEEAAEKGILGLLSFTWLVVAAAFRALYHFARGEERAWAAAALASLVGLGIHGTVDTVFYRPSVQILFWLTLAVIMHLPHRERGAA